jgi:hypothetical protein
MLSRFNFAALAVIVESLCDYLGTAAKKSHKVCLTPQLQFERGARLGGVR